VCTGISEVEGEVDETVCCREQSAWREPEMHGQEQENKQKELKGNK